MRCIYLEDRGTRDDQTARTSSSRVDGVRPEVSTCLLNSAVSRSSAWHRRRNGIWADSRGLVRGSAGKCSTTPVALLSGWKNQTVCPK